MPGQRKPFQPTVMPINIDFKLFNVHSLLRLSSGTFKIEAGICIQCTACESKLPTLTQSYHSRNKKFRRNFVNLDPFGTKTSMANTLCKI